MSDKIDDKETPEERLNRERDVYSDNDCLPRHFRMKYAGTSITFYIVIRASHIQSFFQPAPGLLSLPALQ